MTLCTRDGCTTDHDEECYCDEEYAAGYTYSDEYGPCHVCLDERGEE